MLHRVTGCKAAQRECNNSRGAVNNLPVVSVCEATLTGTWLFLDHEEEAIE